MSPFETAVADVERLLRRLTREQQCAVFLAASHALRTAHNQWATAAGKQELIDQLTTALRSSEQVLLSRDRRPEALLSYLEASTPAAPTDVAGFTAAQDCWICLDTSVRGMGSDFEPASASWHLLEPIFQAASERIFSYSDVGSAAQDAAESVVLRDASVSAALDAVRRIACDENPVSSEGVQLLKNQLLPLGEGL
jgi:hypothetical protein